MTLPAPIRPATVSDIDELLRLRTIMFGAMGVPTDGPSWRKHCAEFLREVLVDGSAAAFVAEPESEPGHLVASGIGTTDRRLPGPGNLSGRRGHIASMVTEPAWRGQGLASAIVAALQRWFTAHGIATVYLHATAAGEPIYRAAGFAHPRYLVLRWHAGD